VSGVTETATAPRVSVLMSVHNGARYLRDAVDSLLAQTFTSFELLVVDDASSDDTAAILASYSDRRLRVITNESNIGLTKSLNKALRESRGELIARQDGDDRSRPERLRKQVEFLDRHREVVLIGTGARTIDPSGALVRARMHHRAQTPLGVRWQLLFGNPFTHSSVMFRRAVVLDQLGGYDETYYYNQDFELWSRVIAGHDACNLAEELVDYRMHSESIAGRREAEVIESRIANVKKNIGVQQRNIRGLLGDEELAAQWPPLWTALSVPWLMERPPNARDALRLAAELRKRFTERYPQAKGDRDVSLVYADALWAIGRYLTRSSPFLSATVLARSAGLRLRARQLSRQEMGVAT
jgi:hypothetical protein